MSNLGQSSAIDGHELRERVATTHEGSKMTSSTDAEPSAAAKSEVPSIQEVVKDDRKTYGRTPAGEVFIVPHTEDMVTQLFDPTQPKNTSDFLIVGVLAFMAFTWYLLPNRYSRLILGVWFVFWRLSYNVGIGWLLYNQSNHKRLTTWAKRSGIFNDPSSKTNSHPYLYRLLEREMQAKIPKDYKFSAAPLEYNTWLLFRRVVDLILMSDFTSYCLFAIACGRRPDNESWPMTAVRWIGGWLLVLFNLWVKLDAHRVVKDFAWYWGDFFFLIDQELTFDGVFELAPHPMYSLGYFGMYGISMMAASYKVLFISIFAHATQLIFLHYIETPHIEKTYNTPPVTRRSEARPEAPNAASSQSTTSFETSSAATSTIIPALTNLPLPVHTLAGLQNLDLHRITDVAVIVLHVYLCASALLTPSTPPWQTLFVLNAVAWRLWFSLGIGYILDRQSQEKSWTRHFVKHGETTQEAWRQWKGIYHISSTMCFTSFVCAAWKMYGLPQDWSIHMAVLRHVIGIALVLLHVWTVSSIYESLGEFGWFFGDFFFEDRTKLTYSGIYRYLNNPERTIGLAGFWGAVILTWSKTIFLLALLSHALTIFFIQFIEHPHMQKLYRHSLRDQSGVSRNFHRSLPPPLQKWSGSVDRVFDEGLEFVEEFIDAAGPKLAAGINAVVADTKLLFKQFPTRISVKRLAPELAGLNPKDYSLTIDVTQTSVTSRSHYASGREGEDAQKSQPRRDDFGRLILDYGASIKVTWTAPLNHSSSDWIGLYRVGDNAQRDVTKIGSQGRWVATNPGVYDVSNADIGILLADQQRSGSERQDGETTDFASGEVEFAGDKLWWTQGVFEFRYHHDGKYNVMATSLPFEIHISRFDKGGLDADASGEVVAAMEDALLSVVQRCFDQDQDVAPRTVDETFGPTLERGGKYARRVVYAVQQMFGIEFAPEVVQADGNVRRLAWRIWNAKRVLAPYSMSHSRGCSTPT